MIIINFKYALISFLILVVLCCATVLLTINSNDESSSVKLVTSISQGSDTDSDKETSHSIDKTKAEKTKKAASTAKSKRTAVKTSKAVSPKKTSSYAKQVKFPLDINKATKDELIQIDGIGEVTAKKILSYRKKHKHYSNLLQLKEIDGIGDATYMKLKKYLYVSKDMYREMSETLTTVKSKNTSKTKVKTTKCTSKTKVLTSKPMRMVNINTASKEELMDCLLIDEEEALQIIDFRKIIGGKYNSVLELVYELGESEYNRIKDYVTI